MTKLGQAIAVLILAGVVTSCGSPDRARLGEVSDLLDEARIAHAEEYAPKEYEAARKAVDELEAEFEDQSENLPFLRSPRRFDKLARHASLLAQQALKSAQQAEANDRATTSHNLEEATEDLAAARTALAHYEACEPRPEGWKKQVESFENDLETLELDQADVKEAMDTGNFLDASDLGDRLLEGASYLLQQVEESVRTSACA